MRLISLHIDNFGTLSDYSYEFNRGLNMICEKNGYGKSTMASFLRVMFYGFEGEGKKSNIDKERHRFLPWQGGTYGGSITYEAGGKEYILTRRFGKKKDDDEIMLQDAVSRLEIPTQGECLGEMLFDLDADSFQKSIYISQTGLQDGQLTDQIGVKIGGLGTEIGDLDQYNKALVALKDRCNALTDKRSTGELRKATDQLTRMKTDLDKRNKLERDQQELIERMKEPDTELRSIAKKKDELDSKYKESMLVQQAKLKVEEYSKLKQDVDESRKAYSVVQDIFPAGVPGEEEVAHIREVYSKIDELEARSKGELLSDDEEKSLLKYQRMFQEGIPDEKHLGELENRCKKLREIRRDFESHRVSDDKKNRYAELKNIFHGEKQVRNQVEDIQNKVSNINALNQQLFFKESEINEAKAELDRHKMNAPKEYRGNDTSVGVLFIVLGILLLIGGVLMMLNRFGQNQYVWFLVGGVVCLITGIIVSARAAQKKGDYRRAYVEYKNQERVHEDRVGALSAEKAKLISEANALDNHIYNRLLFYGENITVREYNQPVNNLLVKAIEYENLCREMEQSEESEAYKQKLEESNQLAKSIYEEIRKYGMNSSEEEFSDAIREIKFEYQNYVNLISRKENFSKTVEELEKCKDECNHFVRVFGLHKLGERMKDIFGELPSAIRDYDYAFRKKTECEKKIHEFVSENPEFEVGVPVIPDEIPEIDSIKEELEILTESEKKLKSMKESYEAQYKEISEQIEDMDIDQSKIDELEEAIAEMRKKLETASLARKYLETARENLILKYTGPLTSAFTDYYKTVTGKDGDNIHIDAKANVKVYEQGMDREAYFFSEGNKDLLGLCMRLAYADAMYEKEKPFLIMDDPFVNMDDERTKGAYDLLKKITDKYQVIFYSCHAIA
ncbi:MAG: AAA family ATPase [Lachnospiraceae bacterium]|nr:AAA family ATPase [Candidatus Merdinaster equi]